MRLIAGLSPKTDSVIVTLDGEPVTACVEADDVEGWVEVLSRNAEGVFYVVDDSPATERRHGEVVFRWDE